MEIKLHHFLTKLKTKTGFSIWHNENGESNSLYSSHSHDLEIGKQYRLKGNDVILERIAITPTVHSKKSWLSRLIIGPAISVKAVYSYKFYSDSFNAVSSCPLDEFLANIEETDLFQKDLYKRIKEINQTNLKD